MNIIIDIGHPGHVHYFRNMIKKMEGEHNFLVFARKRGVVEQLLDHYGIKYILRGKGRDTLLGKLTYMLKADILMFKHARKFKPDIFLSFSSPYAAQVASFMRKPHIALNDTEHTDAVHAKFTYRFSTSIITPAVYLNDLGEKHIRFNALIEYLYLHPNYYSPDPGIYKLMNIDESKAYVILRFVSWVAHHDVGQKGLDKKDKLALIDILERKGYKVLISSEADLEEEFEKYRINIAPERMHDALAFAHLFIGESATMASESALLGTYAVYVNSLPLMGYLKLEQEKGLLKHFKDPHGILEHVEKLLNDKEFSSNNNKKKNELVKDFIDPTDFMINFVQEYFSNSE